jgi:hypothetical protein
MDAPLAFAENRFGRKLLVSALEQSTHVGSTHRFDLYQIEVRLDGSTTGTVTLIGN